MVRRGVGLALATLVLSVAAGCGEAEEGPLPDAGTKESSTSSPTATSPTFAMPSPGDDIGVEVAARPPDEKTSAGASRFAAWALSLLLHTPREATSTDPWSQATGTACEPCRRASEAWQDQESKGQSFEYAGAPRFRRTAVRAQPQGDGWFVQFEVSVPRSTLSRGDKVLESVDAETLGYSFNVVWDDDEWRIADFHVLG